jgi:hypothetical protein
MLHESIEKAGVILEIACFFANGLNVPAFRNDDPRTYPVVDPALHRSRCRIHLHAERAGSGGRRKPERSTASNSTTQEIVARSTPSSRSSAREEALKLPPSGDRQAMLTKARQLEKASHIKERMSLAVSPTAWSTRAAIRRDVEWQLPNCPQAPPMRARIYSLMDGGTGLLGWRFDWRLLVNRRARSARSLPLPNAGRAI